MRYRTAIYEIFALAAVGKGEKAMAGPRGQRFKVHIVDGVNPHMSARDNYSEKLNK